MSCAKYKCCLPQGGRFGFISARSAIERKELHPHSKKMHIPKDTIFDSFDSMEDVFALI
jgi:hypothetical protein